MTDADLIRAIRSGDESALETLYRRYLPSVWRYAYAQLAGNIHAAEDVTSETFLTAVRQIGSLDPAGGSIGGWLIGVARHKVGDHRRRSRRMTVAVVPEETIADRGENVDPPGRLETAETRACVAAIMDGLQDDERLVLEWKYLEDLSVRQMAERLGRTVKAVEAALYRARNAFRAAFERAQRAAG